MSPVHKAEECRSPNCHHHTSPLVTRDIPDGDDRSMSPDTRCVVPGLGQCRALYEVSPGYWRVLRLKNDEIYRIPQNRIVWNPQEESKP